MVKEITLRKWHRNVGLVVMPLILLQVVTGLFLSLVDSFGMIERTPQASPQGVVILIIRKLPDLFVSPDKLMMTLHFAGGRLLGSIIRLLTAAALLWVMFSGTYIFVRIRARRSQKR